MAQKQLSEITEEELKKNIRMMTVAVAVLATSILIMFISAVYSYKKRIYGNSYLAICFCADCNYQFENLKKMKTELASRKKYSYSQKYFILKITRGASFETPFVIHMG